MFQKIEHTKTKHKFWTKAFQIALETQLKKISRG